MNVVRLLPVGNADTFLLQDVYDELPRRLPVHCAVSPVSLDPVCAYHVERQQYHSSEIIARVQSLSSPQDWRVLAIAAVDLYIPILKYIFGEAQMGGRCALVSYHRLRQEFYGLDPDPELLSKRLLKECVHELGHTFGLSHCQDYACAMASAHAVEWIDLREPGFCDSCRAKVLREPR